MLLLLAHSYSHFFKCVFKQACQQSKDIHWQDISRIFTKVWQANVSISMLYACSRSLLVSCIHYRIQVRCQNGWTLHPGRCKLCSPPISVFGQISESVTTISRQRILRIIRLIIEMRCSAPNCPTLQLSSHGRMGRRLTDGGLLSKWKWVVQVYYECIRQTGCAHVWKCVPPIGWRAHQADNSGHWLVRTLLIF